MQASALAALREAADTKAEATAVLAERRAVQPRAVSLETGIVCLDKECYSPFFFGPQAEEIQASALAALQGAADTKAEATAVLAERRAVQKHFTNQEL